MLPTAAVVLVLASAPTPAVQVASLARMYREFDLPLPPKDAKLYRFTLDYLPPPGDPPPPPSYEFGFGLAADKKGKPTSVLVGFYDDDWVPEFATTVIEILPGDGWSQQFRKNSDELAFAGQCEILGWHTLALTAFTRWREHNPTVPDANRHLALLASDYWKDQFRNHNADRAKVARRMNALHEYQGRGADDMFLINLNLSLKPSKAKAGTPEAAIDDLMDVAGYRYRVRGDSLDPRLEAVYRHGFEAIPALIAHLDDDRITRTYHYGYGSNFGVVEAYDYSVKHLARDILYRYAGTENAQEAAHSSNTPNADSLKEWWKEAQKEGEDKYLIRRVLSNEAWETGAHDQLLSVILAKYPKRLPDVFAGLKKADPMWTPLDPFVGALLRSSLPAADQKKQLLAFLDSSEHEWQAAALRGLHHLDADDFHKRLIATFADLPTWEDKDKRIYLRPSCYTCFADTARLTTDAKVWAAVDKYLASATAEVKLEWVNHLGFRTEKTDKCYRRVVACLAELLKDKTFRAEKSGDRLHVTEVRNCAAERLGELLGVRGTPAYDAPFVRWEDYREKVGKAAEAVTKKKG